MIHLDGDTFTLSDFERSATAKRLKIENKLEGDDILDYQFLIDKVILPIYKKYQQPIYINSGFRSKLLNEKVGGVKNSQHLSLKDEAAADIDTRKGKAENKVLFDIIADMVRRREIPVDQLIDEKGCRWIHISTKRTGSNRYMILSLQ
jgi:hypothetical protein